MYKQFAADAKKEGYDHIADLFLKVGEIEKFHQKRYEQLLKQVEDKTVFSEKKEVY
jgi:rubrerythrin